MEIDETFLLQKKGGKATLGLFDTYHQTIQAISQILDKTQGFVRLRCSTMQKKNSNDIQILFMSSIQAIGFHNRRRMPSFFGLKDFPDVQIVWIRQIFSNEELEIAAKTVFSEVVT